MTDYSFHPAYLTFNNPELEQQYIHENDGNHIQFYRAGLILSILVWLGGLIWSYIIIPQYIVQCAVIIVGVLVPIFVLVFRVTYLSPIPHYFQGLIALANLVAGLAILYISIFLLEDYGIASVSIAILIGFAHFILKLRFKIAVVITIAYTLVAQILVLAEGNYTLIDLLGMSLGFWVAMIAFGLAGYYHEKILRNSFLQDLQIAAQREQIIEEQAKSKKLLLNILPEEVAKELMETGNAKPAKFEEVSILFSDFIGFTNIVATIPTKKLIHELNELFSAFDDIMESEGIEKIQTVGDAYLAACGVPKEVPDHAVRCVRAGKKIIHFLEQRNRKNAIKWNIRIGVHSGPISAGVVGKRKFAYDIFGDTINTASRIETAGGENRINVSAYTYDLIKETFPCKYRGKINAKGKGELDMYFVN